MQYLHIFFVVQVECMELPKVIMVKFHEIVLCAHSSTSQLPEQCPLESLVDHLISFAALNSAKAPTYNNDESRSAFEGAVTFCTNTLGPNVVPPIGGFPQQSQQNQGRTSIQCTPSKDCFSSAVCPLSAAEQPKTQVHDSSPSPPPPQRQQTPVRARSETPTADNGRKREACVVTLSSDDDDDVR